MDTGLQGVRRRDVIRASGALGAVAIAGCTGDDSPDDTPGDDTTQTEPEPEQQLPRPVAGNPDAAVTVASFEDFACPHCATYSLEVLPEIWSTYVEPGEIRYEWFDLPIPDSFDGTGSWEAAVAARSVQANTDDGAFWTFAESVFENQNSLSLDRYETLANDAGADGATVRQETEDRTYEPTVRYDRGVAVDREVSATPTVFVDGEPLQAPDYDELSTAIDDALDAA